MPKKTKRSPAARAKFLKKRGLSKTPRGKEIDHKVPLSKGGSNSQKNLRLIKKSTHKKKTATETRRRARRSKSK